MYKIIDGKALASGMRASLAENVARFRKETGREIRLAVVLAGNNAASAIYVRNKIKACEEAGIKSDAYYLPENVAQEELENLIKKLAADDGTDGILVQLPLPKHLSDDILKLIPAEKDVDGFTAENIGKLCLSEQTTVACTPFGIMKMLESEHIETKGKNAVILGRSNIVGRPMAMLLLNADATVTVCHSKTRDLRSHCLNADILISAIGKPKFVTADMVKEGATVIDVGINRDENGKLCGDVDFDNVKEKCAYITPVPGGVGPMTVTMLLYNTYLAAVRRKN